MFNTKFEDHPNKAFTILTFSVAVFFATSAKAEWVFFNASKDGSTRFFYDSSSMKKSQNGFNVDELMDDAEIKSTAADGHLSVKLRKAYNCESKSVKYLSMTAYSDHMATGKIIKRETADDKWNPVGKDSINATMLNKFCDNATGPSAANTGFRTAFIKGAAESCYKTQRNNPVNDIATDTQLKKYCSCFATYLADIPNQQLLRDVGNGDVPISALSGTMQLASTYCTKNYTRR